jgi:hypothetical protein
MRCGLALLLVVLGGCAARRLPPPPPPPKISGPSFVDLQTGWRVQVVTPLLKSGGYLLKAAEQTEEGNTITLRVGDEFQGYETALYAVGKERRIRLTEVTLNQGGTLTHPAKSRAPRLRVPGRMRHVRLLYTLKVSDADHNMAVLAARDEARLGALTAAVQGNPAGGCRSNRNEYCEWIPAGVAVKAERPDGAAWVPVR